MPKLKFVPSQHGFHFGNSFQELFGRGLCGGMSLAVFNYHRHEIPIPTHRGGDFGTADSVPPPHSRLRDYIFKLQVGSFATIGAIGLKGNFQWMLSDFDRVRAAIDRDQFVLLALRMQKGQEGLGHQVLAYGYDAEDRYRRIYIYDPNYPNQEMMLEMDTSSFLFTHGGGNLNQSTLHYASYFVQIELDPNAIDILTEGDRPTYMDIAVHEGIKVSKPVGDDGLRGMGEWLWLEARVRNFGDYPAHLNSLILWAKDPKGNNRDRDLGLTLNVKTIQPGESRLVRHELHRFGDQVGSYTFGLAYKSEQGHQIPVPTPLGNTQNPVTVNVVDRSISPQRWYRVTEALSPTPVPAVGVDQDKKLELFARKSDGSMLFLRQRVRNGSKDWVLGRLPGEPVISGSPAVVPSKDGRLEVFARGRNGQLWHCWQKRKNARKDSDWAPWVARGGDLNSDPAATRNDDGRLEVFAVFKNGVMHKLYQDFVNVWSIMGFVAMPAPMLFVGNPSAHADQKGRLVVAARGKDNAIWFCHQKVVNGPYYPWTTLGGSLASDPVLACDKDGRLEVFALGTDNRMRHCWQKRGLGWTSNWRALDDHLPSDQHQTAVAGARCAASLNRHDGCLVVAVTVAGSRVKTIAQTSPNAGWGEWRDHGGPVDGTVALGINPNGVLELFARDPLNQLQHTWYPV